METNGTPRGPLSSTSTPKSTGKRGRGVKGIGSATDDDEASESPTKNIKAAKTKKNISVGVTKGSAPIKQERASEQTDSEATTIKKEADGMAMGSDDGEMERDHVWINDTDDEA